jgi:hypothetical protein
VGQTRSPGVAVQRFIGPLRLSHGPTAQTQTSHGPRRYHHRRVLRHAHNPIPLPRQPLSAHTGIGRATAVELSHAGWTTILVARNRGGLTDTNLLCSTAVDVVPECGDVADEEFVLGVFTRCLDRFGAISQLHALLAVV